MHSPATQPRKVLVLDGDLIPALTIARSLGGPDLDVDVASHLASPLAARSRHVRQALRYPNPMLDEAAFIAWVRHTAQQKGYTLIIPVTERTVVPFFRHRQLLEPLPVALPNNDSLGIALDKSSTFDLARKLDIPVPRGVTVRDTAQLTGATVKTLSFPIVVKPARSMGNGAQGIVQLAVDYAFDETQLFTKTRHALRYGDVILQEYFGGRGTGIELIADRGKIAYAFQHLRLHEVPLTGGGSSLRVSVPVEPVLLDAASKLMAALKWHGVAMVEFKWNAETREFRLMEINGRFWGSLPLAVAAGADFPAMLYELMTQGHIAPRPAARAGVYGRKLCSDLYWYEQVLRRNTPEKPLILHGGGRLLKDALLAFSPHHHFDVQQWRDPLPGLIDLGRIAKTYAGRIGQLIDARVFAWRQKRAWSGGTIATRLRTARSVLFVCYGNINRSALAGRYFSDRTAGMPIATMSAGFHTQSGRPADPNMAEIARASGIDLATQRSRVIDHAMVGASDLIFVMEKLHYDQIAKDYPEAADKTFLLNPAGEIDDPYGKSTAVYQRCMQEVTASIDHLVNLLTDAKKM